MMDFLNALFLEPLAFDFMRRALVVSVVVGVVCALFSCFLVLKGWALMGDAVSHAVLPGLALAYVGGIPLALGAFLAGVLCAMGIGYVKEHSRVKEDAVMGVLFSGMFALGLVLLAHIETDVHVMHVLFGNVLGITDADMWEIVGVGFGVSLVMYAKRRDLLLYCFDSTHARAIGLSVRFLHYGLLVLLALTVVSSLKAVGVILVVAMLIAPGAIGYLLSRSFEEMLAVAVLVSVFSCVTGTLVSYHWDVATAPLIVLIQSLFFVYALFGGKRATWKETPYGKEK